MSNSSISKFTLNFFVTALSLLPLPLLRVISELLAFVVYYLLRYRRKVVRRNLNASFSNKSLDEIKKIERSYYRHFCYQIISTFKLLAFKPEELKEHISFENVELLQRLKAEGNKPILLMMGHFGNWEYLSASQQFLGPLGFRVHQIYRPLRSKAVDDLFRRIRERFGSYGVAKNDVGRTLIKLCRDENSPETALLVFIADQTPRGKNVHYWTEFLGQATAFFTGAERLAKKLDLSVVYADVFALSRDHYKVRFELMKKANDSGHPFDVTELYARYMEQTIMRNPALWLWSHRRWKESTSDFPDAGYSDELLAKGYPKPKCD